MAHTTAVSSPNLHPFTISSLLGKLTQWARNREGRWKTQKREELESTKAMGFNQNLRFQKVEGLNDGFEGGEIQNEARERDREGERK